MRRASARSAARFTLASFHRMPYIQSQFDAGHGDLTRPCAPTGAPGEPDGRVPALYPKEGRPLNAEEKSDASRPSPRASSGAKTPW